MVHACCIVILCAASVFLLIYCFIDVQTIMLFIRCKCGENAFHYSRSHFWECKTLMCICHRFFTFRWHFFAVILSRSLSFFLIHSNKSSPSWIYSGSFLLLFFFNYVYLRLLVKGRNLRGESYAGWVGSSQNCSQEFIFTFKTKISFPYFPLYGVGAVLRATSSSHIELIIRSFFFFF